MKTKRIIASDFLTTMMSSALTIYIYWFAYQYFSSQLIISIIGFGQLSGVFLSSLGGGISDSMNKLFFIKTLNFFKVGLLFMVLILENVVNMEILLPLFMFASTVIGGLQSPTLESLVPFLASSDEALFRINAVVSSSTQVASIMAIVLSAVYISFLSFVTIVFVTLFITAIATILLVGLTVETPLKSTSVVNNMKHGASYIFKTPYIRNLIPVALVMNFSFWSIFLLLPKIANDSFSFLKTSYSGMELSFALGAGLGGILFAKFFYDVKDKYRLFKRSLFSQSYVLLLLGIVLLIPNSVLAYTGMLLCWFLYALINTIFSILYFGKIQLNVPREMIGSVFGAILTLFSLVNPMAAIMSGVLVSHFKIPLLIILLSSLMLLAAWSIRFLADVETVFD
ncbi:MFS transporter [Staphylococcus pseudintermedius]|uniref:MFS transporter n=1 Tax=Staphylococcus pseudintermedius TaxID=283734 RepID=UPI00111D9B8D|nr:MFS transporter [Staphylococcus pseudintermedius]EGQ0371118.1 MFS transporter [Staphylococcus pseudintermedius]EGQ3276113.1 MFS transporter [Staphylococcus pseudintermedius]EGQ3349248.1 MFS transporter [Staphylococcus pseudintermedius]EGQ3386327.1 MFS transporter [Staphylococcus pseudintermedius]EGQ3582570.1 MFS transporter [Staphylococcus pseudintermedius]